MKRLLLAASAASMLTASTHAGLIDLETPLLTAPDTHRDNWQPDGGFTSGGAFFNNFIEPTFGSWAGFALSKETDTTTPGFGNQYSAIAGSGAGGSTQFAVGYLDPFNSIAPTVTLPAGERVTSLWVTNTTYVTTTLGKKTSFNKKFGGDSGNDPDYFLLTISGFDASNAPTGTKDFYLADYRFSDNSQDYIVTDWRLVDLTSLGSATRRLEFSFDSSDKGQFGINTPTYVAVDNISTVPEPASVLLLAGAGAALAFRRRRG